MTTDILETGTLSFRIPSIFFYYHFLTGRRLLFRRSLIKEVEKALK